LVQYNNTEIFCITCTVEHNYISLSTVGIQLYVSAIYVGHLQVETDLEISYTRCTTNNAHPAKTLLYHSST